MSRAPATDETPAHAPAESERTEREEPADSPDVAERDESDAGADAAGDEEHGTGYYFYGVLRSGTWRAFRRSSGSFPEDLTRVRYRDLEGLVRAVPFQMPPYNEDRVQEHQRLIWEVSQQDTLLPAPAGVVFRGRRPIIRFLEDQYLPLDEGLALLEGHWELRMHLSPSLPIGETSDSNEVAMHIYSELRRLADAALPFRRERGRVFSAGFLVERTAWLRFMDRANELDGAHPDLTFDITGPWPPYDFVRMIQ